MASPGTPNQPSSNPPPFDMHKFFKPTTAAPAVPQNPQSSSSFPIYPPPPSSSSSYPPQNAPFYYPQNMPYNPQFSTLHQQRSLSFPTPPLQPPSPQNPNAGARLMALLGGPPQQQQQQHQPGAETAPVLHPGAGVGPVTVAAMSQPVTVGNSGPLRMPSSKLPRGRPLSGEHVVYDVDVRLQGEVQPQLEVTPITKYNSDPQLVVGRQIAVNKTYICYGLNQGNIRVLNINTALRHLLRGHTQRVTDMAFFAEDVHFLASASVDGRVYVWKISESSEEEDKPQITAKIVLAVQIMGEGESVHPRVCWHCHKQEVLVVGIGKRVLKIDTTRIGRGKVFSAEDPLKCPVDKLIDGVQFVGRHDGEITDLSMCQWMTSRLVSASTDGTIKIWEDRKASPLAVFRPHDGQPVHSASFLTSPHRPEHIVLITGGPLNREVKVWVSSGEEGWLLPGNGDSWKCMQTLELKSSAEPRVEEAFFNQVVVLPQAGLVLLANAKKNAIYAVHVEYGPYPAATCMDYIAEFSVTMPILSFTGISDILPHGEHIVQVYCVQTQAIQQYALDLSQCLPPPQVTAALEKSDTSISRDAISSEDPHGNKISEMPSTSSEPKPAILVSGSENTAALSYPVGSASIEVVSSQEISSSMEFKSATSVPDIGSVAPPPPPLSPTLSRKVSDTRSPKHGNDPGQIFGDRGGDQQVIDYSVDRQMDSARPNLSNAASMDNDSRNEEKKIVPDDISSMVTPPVAFKHPTHLVTPSEILMAASSSETTKVIEGKSEGESNIQDIVNNDVGNSKVEVKVVGEAGSTQKDETIPQREHQNLGAENKEKYFCSQASDLGIEMARECSALSTEAINDDAQQVNVSSAKESQVQPPSSEEDVDDSAKDVAGMASESSPSTTAPHSTTPSNKGKKQKGKNSQASRPSSPSPSAFNSADSSNEPVGSSIVTSTEATAAHFQAIQETLSQVLTAQKEMQKQMSMIVAVPITKEGRRLEAALGRNLEKAIKANNDALWARIQEETSKNEKMLRERTQQISTLITNFMNKDLPAMLEKIVKKEMAAIGQAAVRVISPAVEKTVTSAISDSFQRGVGDKAVNQLEKSVNSKLEATVARQIQTQFQTSGKQALQETLKSSLEASVIPAFEKSCKTMFEQVNATFQKGMVEHTAAAQQHFESAHSQLALALREAMNSATTITRSLSGELADGQRKLLAFVAAGGNPNVVHPMTLPLGGLHEKVEVPLDPTKELSRLVSEGKYEEAFTGALQRSDVGIVSWLCSQVDLRALLSMVPLPLSQGVLLSLLQQLACDIHKDTSRKLTWMTDVAAAINPTDPSITIHIRPIFEQVYQILNHHRSLPSLANADMSTIRLLMHVINSMLMTCK